MLSFEDRTIELDEETVVRLLAICSMFEADEQKSKDPAEIVRDSIGRIHTTLLKGRPTYSPHYVRLMKELKERKEESASAPIRFIEYPNEFQNLETGIESVFLKRRFKCPMCENAFTAPALKTGSLLVKLDNRTQMDVYIGVRQDSEKEFVDYSLFQILVCPKCLYASQEKDFDVWDAGAREPRWIARKRQKINKKIIAAYHENLTERMRICQKAGGQGMHLFSTERTEDDAAVALDLANSTLMFLIGKVNINRKADLMYQMGLLNLIKSLQFEKQLEDPELSSSFPEIKKKRHEAIKASLECFLKIPDQSVENFDVREGIRFNARKFWAAHELKHLQAFSQAGSSLQRTYNQFTSMVKKAEREFQQEEMKLKKTNEEVRKAKNIQKKEAFINRAKEIDKNIQLIRSAMENYRGVVRVINPIYDSISVIYDKFKEMQRKKRKKAEATA